MLCVALLLRKTILGVIGIVKLKIRASKMLELSKATRFKQALPIFFAIPQFLSSPLQHSKIKIFGFPFKCTFSLKLLTSFSISNCSLPQTIVSPMLPWLELNQYKSKLHKVGRWLTGSWNKGPIVIRHCRSNWARTIHKNRRLLLSL